MTIISYLCRFMKKKAIQGIGQYHHPQVAAKNMVDSEVLSGQLFANEIDTVHENTSRDHNIVIINTNGFIDKAKRRVSIPFWRMWN